MFVANESSIVERQQSLGRHYREAPGDAWITDHARALPDSHNDAIHGVVEPANNDGGFQPYGIHRAVGGDHDAPNPGDLLCSALAACLHSTLRLVAERLEITLIDSEVTATASADVRGALMVDMTVPVGFQRMHCDVRLEVPAETDQKTMKALMVGAEGCCVVFQTLKGGTKVTTDWRIDQL
ncbi:OsmC family protein [Marinobacter sp. SS13-12]|uniref:OsmC family protein n=1 Tax=Marinobacter sp. SS13-12 TaxID=3050451 RepID=UPI002556864B|nr:OsmC family protein [Marinobacter sp. SS13-12]MDK8465247.1 OsmC family protein [Marinobacter sp. SS13-12]